MDINSSLARRLKTSRIGRPLGVMGYRAWTRLSHRSTAPRLMVNSLAKAGTHLLMSLMSGLPEYRFAGRHFTLSTLDLHGADRSGELLRFREEISRLRFGTFMTGHLAFASDAQEAMDELDFRRIHVIRDPRALVVSTGLYMRTYDRHPLHETVNRRFASDDDLFEAVITGFKQDGGSRHWLPLATRLAAFAPWLDDHSAITLRFEDLVGGQGGGAADSQKQGIREILQVCSQPLDETVVDAAAQKAFDPRSATFRSGRVDGWTHHLSAHHLSLITSECGDLAEQFGYDLSSEGS